MASAALLAALEACHQHQGPTRPNFSAIAHLHSVDRKTLQRHYDRSLQPHLHLEDSRCLLSKEQEGVLLDHLERLGKRHLFITPAVLRNMATEITQHQPSDSWARKFVKKHGDRVKCMVVGGMEASRHAAEYQPVFDKWFDLVS